MSLHSIKSTIGTGINVIFSIVGDSQKSFLGREQEPFESSKTVEVVTKELL